MSVSHQPTPYHPRASSMNKPNPMQSHPASARKTSNQLATQQALRKPTPPPVYRPQTAPRALQPKMVVTHQSALQTRRAPVAPPAYRPPAPTLRGGAALQPKSAPNHKLVASSSFPQHQPSVIQRAEQKREEIGPNTPLRLKELYGTDKTYSNEGGLFRAKVGLT